MSEQLSAFRIKQGRRVFDSFSGMRVRSPPRDPGAGAIAAGDSYTVTSGDICQGACTDCFHQGKRPLFGLFRGVCPVGTVEEVFLNPIQFASHL